MALTQLAGPTATRALAATCWAATLLLGLLHLPYPLNGDQALFLHMAQAMDRGAVLYLDVWDNKQPGIIGFYWLAGRLFGFDAIGVHLAEWLWLMAAAGVMAWAARRSLAQPWTAALVPLLTAGLAYWCAGDWFLTQIELLVSLPLAVCVMAGVAAQRQPSRATTWHVVFGAAAGVVALFKLVLGALPALMWLVLIAMTRETGPIGWQRLLARRLLPTALGAAAVLAGPLAAFVASGAWEAFAWTQFVYPGLALREIEAKPLRMLWRHGSWLLAMALPALALLPIALRDLRRERLRLVEALALAWLLGGALVILVQKFSWWPYHFLLLVFPIGCLVASALDRLACRRAVATVPGRADHHRWVALLVVAAMFLLPYRQALNGLRAGVQALQAPAGERIATLRQALDPMYRERIAGTAFLREASGDRAPIYVFGNPNWLLESGRAQALPIHGWAWEFMLASQWAELPTRLRAARPPYLFIDAEYGEMIPRRSPATWAVVSGDYAPIARSSDGGTWYRALGPTTPPSPAPR